MPPTNALIWSRELLNGHFAVCVSDKGSPRRLEGERCEVCFPRRKSCGPDHGPAVRDRVFLNGRFAGFASVLLSDVGRPRRVEGERRIVCLPRRKVCGPDQGPAVPDRVFLNGRFADFASVVVSNKGSPLRVEVASFQRSLLDD